jgi:methylase of polypeptide subunit release factors
MTRAVTVRDGPRATDREAIALLRSALDDAGYREERLAELGVPEPLRPENPELPYQALVLEGAGRLGTLVRLFQLGLAVDTGEVADALAPAPLERLESLGLLERDGACVRATAALVPVLGRLLASDWEPAAAPPARGDHVLGASSPSRILTFLAVREPVESALDVCAGSGLQALLAAAHAGRVVATDVNPRALRFAELNAALNGVENVETRAGSLFDPVVGETFDAIFANPPYIVSPEQEFVFRDSGLPGDSFCEALVRSAPRHLNDGGTAHLLVSWAHGADEDWSAPLRAWVDGSGCDALLLHHISQEPLEYANGQNCMHWRDPETYRGALERWVAYHGALGIERIAWGAIVLRKRRGDLNAVTAVHVGLTACGPAGHHVVRLFRAQETLGRLDEGDGLLRARLRLAGDARLEQTIAFRDGDGVVERALARLDGGLRLQVELDPQMPKLLSLIEAGNAVGEVVAEAAHELGAAGARPERVISASLSSVRLLVEHGFLEPADTRA